MLDSQPINDDEDLCDDGSVVVVADRLGECVVAKTATDEGVKLFGFRFDELLGLRDGLDRKLDELWMLRQEVR